MPELNLHPKMKHPNAPRLFAMLLLIPSLLFAAEQKPNVIFILTDDLGWGDTKFSGHPYAKTPNLDRFATQSTWINQFYVSAPVCSPSRAAFMTGQYPSRSQIHGHLEVVSEKNAARSMPDWLDPKIPTLPALLKTAGYATAHFGKWHLGKGAGAPPPNDYGFDVSKTTSSNGEPLGNERQPYFRAKSTELIVDETISFIKNNHNKPFYVNVWTLLPHATLKPTPAQLKEYEGLEPTHNEPGLGPWMQNYLSNASDLKGKMQTYCASLTDLDTQLGRLFDALEDLKIADNTIVVFSSDNGPEDYRIQSSRNAGVGNTGVLRARKRSTYEGGVRTLGLIRWPGRINAGRVDNDNVVAAIDLMPTLCAITGVELPDKDKMDGEDVSDILFGATRPRTKPLYWEWFFGVTGGAEGGYQPPMLTIRDGEWKLFVSHRGTDAQLFNIPSDPSEERDVAAQNPDIVRSLKGKALDWVATLPPAKIRDKVMDRAK
jgi:arylsulfatase A-like enzyme